MKLHSKPWKKPLRRGPSASKALMRAGAGRGTPVDKLSDFEPHTVDELEADRAYILDQMLPQHLPNDPVEKKARIAELKHHFHFTRHMLELHAVPRERENRAKRGNKAIMNEVAVALQAAPPMEANQQHHL
jgi:hypothetical protein